jgi:hypothetical protein
VAGTLAVGIALIGLTGFLEGPAYSGTIALRQRHAPPAVRAQVMTTLTGVAGLMLAAGAALGGVVDDPLILILIFVAANLTAAAAAIALGNALAASPTCSDSPEQNAGHPQTPR